MFFYQLMLVSLQIVLDMLWPCCWGLHSHEVIAFSSSASRLFLLWKMTAFGQQQLLQAVDSLVADGGTNIAEGLRKAARVVEDRQARNPLCSIILLSDGVDSYNLPPRDGSTPDYAPLVT